MFRVEKNRRINNPRGGGRGEIIQDSRVMIILMMQRETLDSCKTRKTPSRAPQMNMHLKLKKNNY